MPYKKPKIEKIQYTIGEVAEMYDISVSKVRYWEKNFDVLNPKRNKKGNRLFSKEDLQVFGMIYNLVEERGMTIEGANQRIKDNPSTTKNDFAIIQKLEKIKYRLQELRDEMENRDD